jgi:hypothetical protein
VRIATFNVNGVNGRLPRLLEWLEETQPDIACLQELKAPQEWFPRAELEKAGYGALWHGQKSWNGVAILGRGSEPIETRKGLPGDPDDIQSRGLSRPGKGQRPCPGVGRAEGSSARVHRSRGKSRIQMNQDGATQPICQVTPEPD